MTGDAPATLVWIAAEPADMAQTAAMTSWANAHGKRFAPPADERPPAIDVNLAVAEDVEDLLARARDAITARDGEGAERAVATADALLRAHAELPQAALLMAEVERVRSTRWRRIAPPDLEAAERAWQRAEALDGARVPGLGEVSSTSHPAEATIALGLGGDDQAWLDGQPVAAAVVTRAGPHALAVTAGGALVWAEWIEVPPGTSNLDIDAPTTKPCSAADTSYASLAGDAVEAAEVRCADWALATNGPQPGTIRIAACVANRCGPLVDWRTPPPWTRAPPADVRSDAANSHPHGSRWPAWATWALAGAGVAVAAGVGIAASGALQSAPTETRFINGGLKTQ